MGSEEEMGIRKEETGMGEDGGGGNGIGELGQKVVMLV